VKWVKVTFKLINVGNEDKVCVGEILHIMWCVIVQRHVWCQVKLVLLKFDCMLTIMDFVCVCQSCHQ